MVRVIFGEPVTFPAGITPTAIAQDLEHNVATLPNV
jgi:hypothetical protein